MATDTDLAPSADHDLDTDIAGLVAAARDLIDASRSQATRTAYARDWADFGRFCHRHGLDDLPADPATVALYLADMATTRDLAPATIQRRLSAISVVHAEAGHPSPTEHHEIRRLMSGLRRTTPSRQREKRALTTVELRRMVATLDDDTHAGRRDRALLLSGFVGGLRRSELVALNVEDLQLDDRGYTVTIRRSKTDQEGHTRPVILPYSAEAAVCPVGALTAWLDAAEITSGAVFRRVRRGDHPTRDRLTGQSVALILKRTATAASIDRPGQLGGHSLRSGFATTAAARGASERSIARQTGHRSSAVLRRYIRQGSVYEDNAALELGL